LRRLLAFSLIYKDKGCVDDNTMRDNEVRLAVPTMDDEEEAENVMIDGPQFEYA
jgi:hypothetical protein